MEDMEEAGMEEVHIQFKDDTIRENVQKKLLNLINKYKELNDEDKEKFQKQAVDTLTKTLQKVPETIPQKAISPSWLVLCQAYFPFILATSCVTFLLVMGVRGVYRCIWKQKQRYIQKKKLKQQKAEAKLQSAKKKEE
ncbi:hypothetical protein EAG_05209 [Camponotus floridanus]|uniref:Uncharacterized protein n=1 Tax=Camponotus floridanus TaxID=104421 RepID=E1ZXY3_CAMFO|nr:uncharacterized protein LOC105255226 [Camponotus floridanus]EFN73965.1 hypothetical protein EAG_05209 [Camponotus floridanus]